MKALKYMLALAIALCAITSVSHAQTVLIGGGSSALALELGQAAVVAEDNITGANTACLWTKATGNLHSGSTMNATDDRPGVGTSESGNVWVVWGRGSGSCSAPSGGNVYMYTNLDSVLGDRGYFATKSAGVSGYLQNLTLVTADSSTGDSFLNVNPTAGHTFTDTPTGIPATVIAQLNGARWNYAGTDIRPEDALWATFRALQPCNQWTIRQPFDDIARSQQGLGYTEGNQFQDDFGQNKFFHLWNFAISGPDPHSSATVPTYAVSVVGAQPIIVAVSPYGPTGTYTGGIYAASDIPAFVLANFLEGVLARPTDLLGPTKNYAVSALIREPLSGTYNTMEMSNVNSSQFHTSQDANACGPTPINPLHVASALGANINGGFAYRRRVIGTGLMTKELNLGSDAANDERIGYFFWSASNVAGLSNVKYLTVNGADPLQTTYTNGALPSSGSAGDPCPANIEAPACSGLITFNGLNTGAYPIWSALRVVTATPVPTQMTALIAAAQTLTATQYDFVPATKLNVWRSHYYMTSIGVGTAANGPNLNGTNDLCNPSGGALPEQGGDAGGAIILKQANADFCSDYGNNTGLVNKTE